MEQTLSREQFFGILHGTTTRAEIAEKRAYRIRARIVGRRQNEIETLLNAMPLCEFIRFAEKTNCRRDWGKILGPLHELIARGRHAPELEQREIFSDQEWTARKWAMRKVWERRVSRRLPPKRRHGREERRAAALAARGQGKAKNR